ncbi:DUF4436 family protein [Kitasatospora sp. SUK 42]|uniref:DUF4436 family protein n=1 Tax=Kitasatospora sp. SUK 42 TaxID=1588882 RepID=UPI0018CAC4DC|nr:DUF4436 family protein [Kitasatospora sp. SUK 42]MBV2153264.1 DUF4436 domain-containing protein [Kitasatospora sp. SUK 42]
MSTPPHRRTDRPHRRTARPPRPTARPRVRLHTRVRAVSATRPKVRPWSAYAVVVVIALSVTAGLLFYLNERSSRGHAQVVGAAPGPDLLEVDVLLQRVDPAAQTVTAKVLVQPHGALRVPGDQLVPAQDVVLETTSLEQTSLRYPAGQRIGSSPVSFSLFDGRVTDYPFDGYQVQIGFRATAGGRPAPVVIGVEEADPFFAFTPGGTETEGDAAQVTERISRSRSTFILAWFMMAAMWALALAVLLAAWLIVRQRRGIVWPALGWMAATLFALVGMRNAAPGSPPIGSLLDYAAFFWAELLVAVGLIMVVVRGARVEGAHRPQPL